MLFDEHNTYVNPTLLPLIEYAGRTCYRTNDRQKKTTRCQFIQNIVNSGHESVIEHSNICLFASPTNDTMIQLLNIQELIPLRIFTYLGGAVAIHGNVRMFKDIIRAGKDIPDISDHFLYREIKDFILRLPECLTSDISLEYENPHDVETSSLEKQLYEHELNIVDAGKFGIKLLNVDNPDYIGSKIITDKHVARRLLTATFQVDMPRSTSHQEVRHRISSYSQESQRYVRMTDDIFDYYTPDGIDPQRVYKLMNDKGDASIDMTYDAFMEIVHAFYNALTADHIKAEDAREILPNATISRIVITRTIEQWKHYFDLRCDTHAQKPIRDRATIIRDVLGDVGYGKLLD